MSRPVGILLAAGQSRRFGTDKLLHPLPDGTPLALAAAKNLCLALPETVAVVAQADSAVAGLMRNAGIPVVVNAGAEDGMGTSIACGVRACDPVAGWVIALADMPFIEPETIVRVAAALTDKQVIAAPAYVGRRGHPVGFGAGYYEALAQLVGDRGARGIVQEHRDRLHLVPTDDPGVLRDIDRREDL
ncbi:nucleotidyltransferase family protein [Thiohalobacter thiocyanaticus]|uniref:Nucleotidyltransferase family protein n=1 Tax=Thiohalobacter thiocyanaticus TaxID=585455 RepID=A0A426QM10_9GAMM|nr:nucleotidyltransferase family protein [Thiohalobacter thiocyanaticus]RRQ22803.1 nucleotidyltransferase family protein [Thiohalobacter thiocyanaticus]